VGEFFYWGLLGLGVSIALLLGLLVLLPRLGQGLRDIIHLLTLVEIKRLAEELLLVAKCGVKTRSIDSHGPCEIGE